MAKWENLTYVRVDQEPGERRWHGNHQRQFCRPANRRMQRQQRHENYLKFIMLVMADKTETVERLRPR